MSNWNYISSGELPIKRDEPYQVIAAQRKVNGGLYTGTHKRIFTQDWHVRMYPQNFVAWMYDITNHVWVDDVKEMELKNES